MPAYDRTFSPPASVADVILIRLITGARNTPLRGRLDSGYLPEGDLKIAHPFKGGAVV